MLSRRIGERIWLKAGDHEIWLQVLGRGPHGVRLGIQAPPEVTISRPDAPERAPRRAEGPPG